MYAELYSLSREFCLRKDAAHDIHDLLSLRFSKWQCDASRHLHFECWGEDDVQRLPGLCGHIDLPRPDEDAAVTSLHLFDDLVETVRDVIDDEPFAFNTVSLAEGTNNLLVLRLRLRPTARHIQPADKLNSGIHITQKTQHFDVAGEAHEHLMKLLIQRYQVVRGACRHFARAFRRKLIEFRQLFFGCPVNRELDGRYLKLHAELVEVEDLFDIQRLSEKSVVCREGKEAFRGQTVERLTKRRPAYAQFLGKNGLVQSFAGKKTEGHSHIAQFVMNAIYHALRRGLFPRTFYCADCIHLISIAMYTLSSMIE
jgi:hypothetical protein